MLLEKVKVNAFNVLFSLALIDISHVEFVSTNKF